MGRGTDPSPAPQPPPLSLFKAALLSPLSTWGLSLKNAAKEKGPFKKIQLFVRVYKMLLCLFSPVVLTPVTWCGGPGQDFTQERKPWPAQWSHDLSRYAEEPTTTQRLGSEPKFFLWPRNYWRSLKSLPLFLPPPSLCKVLVHEKSPQ